MNRTWRMSVIAGTLATIACCTAAAVAYNPSATQGAIAQANAAEAGADEASAADYYAGIGDTRFPSEGTWIENLKTLPTFLEDSEKDARNGAAQQPRQYTDRFGFTVQPVPNDDIGYNLSYLDADRRGCTSCHTLEEACLGLEIGHQVLFHGYPTIQTVDNCRTCHWPINPKFPYRTDLRESIHGIHNGSAVFRNMDGSCTSCHEIDHEGNFALWDDVRYDVMRGITDVSAEDANLQVSYDQDTVTDASQMYFKSEKSDPKDWHLDNDNIDPSIQENWVISFEGDIANPCEMTIPELVEKFGTEKRLMKNTCMVNGTGNALAFQAEVEGIPLDKIIEYLQPSETANCYKAYSSSDKFGNPQPLDYVLGEGDGLLVIKMNGELLPASQGYPVVSMMNMASGCEFTKLPDKISITTEEEGSAVYKNMMKRPTLGKVADPNIPEPTWKPNSAVLNMPSGVVLEDQVGKPVTIEGFADANEEPITKVEFSLDHGKTWTEMETPDNDPNRWTYWRVSFTPEEEGAYLLQVRTTSRYAKDGTEHTSRENTQFMFNVR